MMPSIWIILATVWVACAAIYAFVAEARGQDALRALGTGLFRGPYGLARLFWGKPPIPDIWAKCQHCGTRQVIGGDADWFECQQCWKRSDVPKPV